MRTQVVHEVGEDTLAALKALFEDVRAHDGHAAIGEHKWLDLVHGGKAGFAGVIATDDENAEPIGYAQLSRHPDTAQWGLEIVVRPDRRDGHVGAALGREALAFVKEAGGGHLHWWVFKPTEVHDRVAQELHLQRGRDLLHMRIPLPIDAEPVLPPDVEIRPFDVGRDEQAWLDLNNRAFAHHPEQGAWDEDTLHRRMDEQWFDPKDLLLAVDGEGVVGSNWTKLDRDTHIGEIYVIAVDPSRHGAGLGKALSVAGLRHMGDNGMREGSLYVDAANSKALHMYRDIGFSEHHLDRAYVADI